MRELRPTPTAHHNKAKIFISKDLSTCTHVFVCCDHVKKPLEPPYRGPYKIIDRLTDILYKIEVEGTPENINLDRLKPTYVSKTEVIIQFSYLISNINKFRDNRRVFA